MGELKTSRCQSCQSRQERPCCHRSTRASVHAIACISDYTVDYVYIYEYKSNGPEYLGIVKGWENCDCERQGVS